MDVQIINFPHRPFTTTEELGLSSFFGDLIRIDDDSAWCPFSQLQAIGDNLYRVKWVNDAEETEGAFSLFCSLHQAMETTMAVNNRMFR